MRLFELFEAKKTAKTVKAPPPRNHLVIAANKRGSAGSGAHKNSARKNSRDEKKLSEE